MFKQFASPSSSMRLYELRVAYLYTARTQVVSHFIVCRLYVGKVHAFSVKQYNFIVTGMECEN
jgi:hypothetical protein